MQNNEYGYTTIELIVAMSMVGLIAVFAYSVYSFARKGMNRWQNRVHLENSAHIAVNAITNDLLKLQRFYCIGEGRVCFMTTDDDTIDYRVEEERLVRNGNAILLDKTSIRFNYLGYDLSLDNNLDGVVDYEEMDLNNNSEIDGKECEFVSFVAVNLSLSTRRHSFKIKTGVVIRNRRRFSE